MHHGRVVQQIQLLPDDRRLHQVVNDTVWGRRLNRKDASKARCIEIKIDDDNAIPSSCSINSKRCERGRSTHPTFEGVERDDGTAVAANYGPQRDTSTLLPGRKHSMSNTDS